VLRRAKFRCNQVTKKEKILKTENRGAISGDISNSIAKNLFLCDLGFRWCMLEKEWGICGRNRQLLQLIEIVTRSSCFVNSETI